MRGRVPDNCQGCKAQCPIRLQMITFTFRYFVSTVIRPVDKRATSRTSFYQTATSTSGQNKSTKVCKRGFKTNTSKKEPLKERKGSSTHECTTIIDSDQSHAQVMFFTMFLECDYLVVFCESIVNIFFGQRAV